MKTGEKPSLSYYLLDLNIDDSENLLGGTGIEITSLVNFLQKQRDRLQIQLILFPPKDLKGAGYWQRINATVIRKWTAVKGLLSAKEQIVLFLYPKVPFITSLVRPWNTVLVAGSYALLYIKKKLTGQKWVVLITDLPVEQKHMLQPALSEHDLEVTLKRFRDTGWMSFYDQSISVFEHFLFRRADTVVSLSRLMTKHLQQKHNLSSEKICQRGRNLYLPVYYDPAEEIALCNDNGLQVLYSGDLSRSTTIDNLKRIIQVFTEYPASHLYICGRGGEWIDAEVKNMNLNNVHYLRGLNYASFDSVASRCDVGLIPYTLAYAHLVPTSKYSAYVANGLAILATDLVTISEMIREDGVGITTAMENYPEQLGTWLRNPELVGPYKERARNISFNYRQGTFMQEWFNHVLSSR